MATILRNLRRAAITLGIALFLLLLVPSVHLTRTWLNDRNSLLPPPSRQLDDASHLNATTVAGVIQVSPDDVTALAQIRSAYLQASREGKHISIAGTRHSMGGQAIAPDGLVLDMLAHDHTHYDRNTQQITVGAGATWDLIIPYLDRFGRSVEVMQSDSPFSVGGSLSVNCHGWQPARPPIASTVIAFTIVTPDGQMKHCSRTMNPDLFAAALGGYGLFGVILDVTLRTVPNEVYRTARIITSIENYERDWQQMLARPDVGLAYGRLSVSPDSFLEEAIINYYTRLPEEPEPLKWEEYSRIERLLFRGSVRSAFGKRLRWLGERHLAPLIHDDVASRNHLLDGDTALYLNRSNEERDILHEYFIPQGKLNAFMTGARTIIQRHDGELLNVTLRDVRRDDLTLLRYATSDVTAVVMFFSQRTSKEDELRMQQMTRELIDAALAVGGRYYLPYRLHASDAQFVASYPSCARFFEIQKEVDPRGLLSNRWFERYSAACQHGAQAAGLPAQR